MRNTITTLLTAGALALASSAALAQGAGTGPVGRACAGDIAKFCAGTNHGGRQARTCLEKNRERVSDDCRAALDRTGGGRGMGRNRGSSI